MSTSVCLKILVALALEGVHELDVCLCGLLWFHFAPNSTDTSIMQIAILCLQLIYKTDFIVMVNVCSVYGIV